MSIRSAIGVTTTAVGWVVLFLFYVVVGTVVIGLGALVIGILADIVSSFTSLPVITTPLGRSSSLNLTVLGLILGPLIGGGMAVSELLGERRDKAKAAAHRRRDAAEEASKAAARRLRDIESVYTAIGTACDSSVAAFEHLPKDLSNSRSWAVEAEHHYANRAYSPFWHAIEQGYACLGFYNQRLGEIARLSQDYIKAVERYVNLGGTEQVPVFPVRLDAANATEVAERASTALGEIVYRAQRDAVFAQIWEQRRTTAAVVAGFANLESAVNRMSRTLREAVATLNSDVRAIQADLGAVNATIRATSSQAAAISEAQLDAQQQLNKRIDHAVYYLREEHKRAIGLV